jgi:mRNA-degrading endonuclease toxin of MazEF toxin-antitoxin module
MGCDGRLVAPDEREQAGRRSRVVLTPRRWRQLATMRMHCAGMVTIKPDHRESKKETVKTIRAGNAGMFGEPVVTCLRAFIFARKAAGAAVEWI